MESSEIIRDAVTRVSALRAHQALDPSRAVAIRTVKALQSRRFAGSYADLLEGGTYAAAARFFLDELYSDRDFSARDAQFARIAGALQTFFPQQVVATAVALAELHVLTEELDDAMAEAWMQMGEDIGSDAARYVAAWRRVGRRAQREQQLREVQVIGHDLARLTRLPGLRLMLRMMRKPASAAGLGSLQQFLETGFDTFSDMAQRRQGAEMFLSIVQARESALIERLFEGELVACATELASILGQAR